MAPQPILSPDSATSATDAANENKKTNASTGPKTAEGKATSSQNAFKHGLASGTLLIPGESPEEWEQLLESLRADWSPATATEELLFGDMAKHHWLKDRAIRMQNEALKTPLGRMTIASSGFALLLRYQTTNERAFARAKKQLEDLQKARREFVSQSEQIPVQSASASSPKPIQRRRSPENQRKSSADIFKNTLSIAAAAGISLPEQLKLVPNPLDGLPKS